MIQRYKRKDLPSIQQTSLWIRLKTFQNRFPCSKFSPFKTSTASIKAIKKTKFLTNETILQQIKIC